MFRFDDFVVDPRAHRLMRGAREIALEPKAFGVLVRLLERSGELLSRDELLDHVWGHRFVTPSTLNRIIGLVRRALDDGAQRSRYVQTVHGAGYRFMGTLEIAPPSGLPRFEPPLVARLPHRLEPLIGRADELRQLTSLLESSRAVTLLGPGGMGKTQCALELAQRHEADYPDGVWFFDLAPLSDAQAWLEHIATLLSVGSLGHESRLAGVIGALADRRALLMLDNCERVASSLGRLLHQLLTRTRFLKVLSTSQQQLQFVGERLHRLRPLELPAVRCPEDAEQLSEFVSAPALSLLLARIAAVQPRYQPALADAPLLWDLCDRLDGMPLALELAAARFAVLSPRDVFDRLQNRFAFLTADAAGRDARHRTLQALLEWSWSLLTVREQRVLAWLGVYVQGWSMEIFLGTCSALGLDAEEMVQLLEGLVAKSLVFVDVVETPPRYRLLESVREFALGQLGATGETQAAQACHARAFRKLAVDSLDGFIAGEMPQRIAQLKREHGNFEGAIDFAVAAGEREVALQLVGGLVLYFRSCGEFQLGLRLCGKVLKEDWRRDDREWAGALLVKGVLSVHWSVAASDVNERLGEARRIAQERGEAWIEAYAAGFHGLWLADTQRYDEAEASVSRATELALRLKDPLLRGLAGLSAAFLLIGRGKLEAALEELTRACGLGNDLQQRHFIEIYMGLCNYFLGRWNAAARSARMALVGHVAVRNTRGISGCIELSAYLMHAWGRPALAQRYLAAAGRMRERTGVPLFRFWLEPHTKVDVDLRRSLGEQAAQRIADEAMREREELLMAEVLETLRDDA